MKRLSKQIRDKISETDPGYLALKRSLKTFIAILISLLVFWQTPGMAMFAAISSMLISRSQAGFTITERRFTMLTTGILMAMLSIPVSLVSQNDWVSVAYALSASFIVFFLIGSRVVPDFPVITLLAMGVVEMAFSHTVASGLRFGGLFLMTTALVYFLHFVLWPTRPRLRLKAQINIMLANAHSYHRAIHSGYPDAEAGMRITQELSDKLRKSIGDFRRLWQLFGVKSPDTQSIESRYLNIYEGLGKMHEFLIILWQFRVSAWNSELYKKLIIEDVRINQITNYLLHRHDPSIIKPSQTKIRRAIDDINEISSEYLQKFSSGYRENATTEWLAVINSLKALETLAMDLQRLDRDQEIELPEFSLSKKIRSFFTQLAQAFKNLKLSNPAFRLGIRSALIIGATMAYSVFYEPDFGYWLVLFAVLLIRPNLGISIKAGRERLLGTVAGSLLALGFILIVPVTNPAYYFFLLLSLYLMLWFINLNLMIPMVTALTFMIVGLFQYIYPDDGNLVWLRILYTLAVVLLVIFVSFLLWPEKARKKFANTLANAIEVEKDYFVRIVIGVVSGESNKMTQKEKQKFRDRIQQLNEVIDATKNEVIQEKVIVHGLNIRSYILRLINTLQSLDASSQKCVLSHDPESFSHHLNNFSKTISAAFDSLTLALRNRQSVAGFPDIQKEFELIRNQFDTLEYTDGNRDENLAEYWRNSAFIWHLKPLVLELEGIKNEIDLKIAEN